MDSISTQYFYQKPLTDIELELIRVNSLVVIAELEKEIKKNEQESDKQEFEKMKKQNQFYQRRTHDLAYNVFQLEQQLIETSANLVESRLLVEKERFEKQQMAVDLLENFRQKQELMEFESKEKIIQLEEELNAAAQQVISERYQKEDALKKMELIEFELLEKQCQQEETMLDEKQKQYGEIEKLQHQIVHVNSELVIEQLKKQDAERLLDEKQKQKASLAIELYSCRKRRAFDKQLICKLEKEIHGLTNAKELLEEKQNIITDIAEPRCYENKMTSLFKSFFKKNGKKEAKTNPTFCNDNSINNNKKNNKKKNNNDFDSAFGKDMEYKKEPHVFSRPCTPIVKYIGGVRCSAV